MTKDSSEKKEKPDRSVRKLVWCEVENEDLTRVSFHCYVAAPRQTTIERILGASHDGNWALCNSRLGISEDGESFLPIENIVPSELVRERCCKRCLKIYDKLIAHDTPTR